MSSEGPKPFHREGQEAPHVMNERETVAFLEERGVTRVDPEKWQPHQPVLYVMEEIIRHHENGPFNDLPRDKRPSIVRVHDPLKIHFDEPRGDADRTIYWLESNRGQVDYYVIDAATGKPELVQTKYSHKMAPNAYHVRKEALFNAADDLFPRA